jgi:hypothetical protein
MNASVMTTAKQSHSTRLSGFDCAGRSFFSPIVFPSPGVRLSC